LAETDILNPVRGITRELQDSMNPNQGWQRTRKSTLATAKPSFGRPYTRETANSGHTYTLNYTRRNLAVSERLKQFFEAYEQDFFTLIDWDNGRHYVGRFVGDMPQSFVANGRYTSQGWTFEELPSCPMLQYPESFERWGITLRPFDGWGDQKAATNSANWIRPVAVLQPDGTSIQPRQLGNFNPAAGDWATMEYRGYGLRVWALQGPEYGIATVTLDGVQVAEVDLFAGAEMGPQIIYENTQVPLDIHRVTLTATNTQNAASLATGVVWDKLEVIR
jgi:hypothetical protein